MLTQQDLQVLTEFFNVALSSGFVKSAQGVAASFRVMQILEREAQQLSERMLAAEVQKRGVPSDRLPEALPMEPPTPVPAEPAL